MNDLSAAAIALLLATALVPASALARSSDRRQAMDIESDNGDASLDESRPSILSGNVKITQGSLKIGAGRAEITQRNGDPVRAILTGGPVTLSQQLDDGTPMTARANTVDYNMVTEVVVFTGAVTITQPRGSLSGARVVYNMKTGQVTSGGGQNGRVKMRILPRSAQAGG